MNCKTNSLDGFLACVSRYKKDFSARLNELNSTIDDLNTFLLCAPPGDLRIRKHRTGHQYWLSTKNPNDETNCKYLNEEDSDLINTYGVKMYLKQALEIFIKERHAIKILSSIDFEQKGEVFDILPDRIKNNTKCLYVSIASKIATWYESDYDRNKYEYDPLSTYKTELGETVRSRAECIIANELNFAGLMYHCEELLILEDGKRKYPDFKVAHPVTGEFYYIEFFGMMDSKDYAAGAFEKIQEYTNDPIYPYMIFLFDYPSAPFSNLTIRKVIKNIFDK